MKARAYSPYVGFPRRLAAALLDLLLLLFVMQVSSWLLQLGSESEPDVFASSATVLVLLLVTSLVLVLFWWVFQGTPGKLLLGCRIVDARSGARPQLWQILVRAIAYGLSAAAAGLGFLWILWDARRQGWHDKLAQTLVINDDESTKTLAELSAECP